VSGASLVAGGGPRPAPKPKSRKKSKARGLSRKTRIRPRNPKRKGSAFPKQRNAAFRRWLCSLGCEFLGATIGVSVSPNDAALGLAWRGFQHRCWGSVDPAHVGKHQATGAPDVGACLPLCRAMHQFYDEHRLSFYRITGRSPEWLAMEAARWGQHWETHYAEELGFGGVPAPQEGKPQ
jgi:hypothetical protein